MPRMLIGLSDVVSRYIGISPDTLRLSIWTLIVIALYALLRLIVWRLAAARIQNASRRYVFVKTVNYLAGAVMLIVVLRIWSVGIGHIASYLGLVAAALVITLQAPVGNLAGWLSIAVQKPFAVGDRVQIGTSAGDVVDISLLHFTLLETGRDEAGEQSTGRIIHIPNGVVFRETVCNATQGFNYIWNEVPVGVTPASNWAKAKEILTQLAVQLTSDKVQHAAQSIARAGQKYMLFYGHLTPIVWTSFREKRVILTVRFLCEVRQRRVSSSRLWEAILAEFAKHDDIELI